MNIVQLAFNAIAPTFLFIVIGYLCKCTHLITEKEQPRMNSIGFKIFLPILLFHQIYTSDPPTGEGLSLLLFTLTAVLCIYALIVLFVLRFEKEGKRRGVMIQALFRSNCILLGLPIITSLYPAAGGIASLTIAVTVPLFNVLAVISLEVFSGKHLNIKPVLRDIAKNPLIIASVIGIVFMVTGLKLPEFIEKTCSKFSGVATPYLLFWLGCFFRLRFRFDKALVCCLLGRLIIIPAIVLPIAVLFGFRNGEFLTVLAIFATPPATSSFTMAQQLGGDAELAGNCVVLGSGLSFFSILLWMCVFMTAGIF